MPVSKANPTGAGRFQVVRVDLSKPTDAADREVVVHDGDSVTTMNSTSYAECKRLLAEHAGSTFKGKPDDGYDVTLPVDGKPGATPTYRVVCRLVDPVLFPDAPHWAEGRRACYASQFALTDEQLKAVDAYRATHAPTARPTSGAATTGAKRARKATGAPPPPPTLPPLPAGFAQVPSLPAPVPTEVTEAHEAIATLKPGSSAQRKAIQEAQRAQLKQQALAAASNGA